MSCGAEVTNRKRNVTQCRLVNDEEMHFGEDGNLNRRQTVNNEGKDDMKRGGRRI